LLLGISHSKTRYHRKLGAQLGIGLEANHFFSSFYAMESEAPYDVVARSGKFCLGFPSWNGTANEDNEITRGGGNPYTQMDLYPLRIGNEVYENCPRIHFVSGMTQKVDDPSKIIIAYGINDCISRFAVVDVAHVIRLLFTPNELNIV
jgi:hypothetical protein